MFELFSRLLNNQQNQSSFQSPPSTQAYTNPALKNYPQEAFFQNTAAAQSNNQSIQNPNTPLNAGILNLLGLLGGNNNDNNALPLLLSMLGKNPVGLSGILETLSKKPSTEKEKKNENDDDDNSGAIDDEILL